jgi:hypothetical protein
MIDSFVGQYDRKCESADRHFVDGILLAAISRGASEITIEPLDGEVRVRYTIAGVRVPACASLPARAAARLAAIVKEYARLDVGDHEHFQEGHVRMRAETCPGRVHDVRMKIDVSPTEFGEAATLHLRDATLAGAQANASTRVKAPPGAIRSRDNACREFERTLEIVNLLGGNRTTKVRSRLLVPRPPGSVRGTWTV